MRGSGGPWGWRDRGEEDPGERRHLVAATFLHGGRGTRVEQGPAGAGGGVGTRNRGTCGVAAGGGGEGEPWEPRTGYKGGSGPPSSPRVRSPLGDCASTRSIPDGPRRRPPYAAGGELSVGSVSPAPRRTRTVERSHRSAQALGTSARLGWGWAGHPGPAHFPGVPRTCGLEGPRPLHCRPGAGLPAKCPQPGEGPGETLQRSSGGRREGVSPWRGQDLPPGWGQRWVG